MNDVAPSQFPLPIQGQRRNFVWRFIQFCFQIFCLVWFRYRCHGREQLPTGGALFLANHQSFLDPLLIAVFLKRPVSYLARDNLFRIPVIGWILKSTYVMPIRRESAGTESIRKSLARLQDGYYVGLFPEGTRTDDGSLGTVKPGFVAIARRGHVPIVPVGIAGAFEAFPRHAWWIRPSRVRIVFGEPIPTETVSELSQKGREQEFVEVVRERLEACHAAAAHWRNSGVEPTFE